MHKPIPALTPEQHESFHHKVKRVGECLEWVGGRSDEGYGRIQLGESIYVVSRVAYRMATGCDPGRFKVCHTCDNPPCVEPTHLFLGSDQDNADDKISKGRARYDGHTRPGSKNPIAKLTEHQVKVIRRSTKQSTVLARMFDVSEKTIRRVRTGEGWKHVA